MWSQSDLSTTAGCTLFLRIDNRVIFCFGPYQSWRKGSLAINSHTRWAKRTSMWAPNMFLGQARWPESQLWQWHAIREAVANRTLVVIGCSYYKATTWHKAGKETNKTVWNTTVISWFTYLWLLVWCSVLEQFRVYWCKCIDLHLPTARWISTVYSRHYLVLLLSLLSFVLCSSVLL